jgi:aerobic C4-dicarboxylate transport protein
VSTTTPAEPSVRARTPWFKQLYFWVLIAIALGIVVGFLWPSVGVGLEPVGTTFVSAIKMIITPIIFLTVVSGIAGVADLRGVGRIGAKALFYFEVVTTVALVIGMVAVNVFKPGAGVHANPGAIEVSEKASTYIQAGESQSYWHFLTDLVPSSIVGAFAEGNVLQVLFFAVLFGVAVQALGPVGAPIVSGVNTLSAAIFTVLKYVMYAAPVGAFGAMAFTIGKYGISTLTSLGKLIGLFYGTSLFFVIVVLGGIAAANKINIFKLLRYLREELLVVLGTSSSESVLPQLMTKLERLGAPRQIVGLTVPTGYSFNLDGTSIYLTLAAIYVAQATDTNLSIGQQVGLLLVMLLTSKGAAGVTGSGFIVLAATLSTVGTIPVAGIMLIFGIDKFMSECRALTNVCGNSLASLVVARWEGVLDEDKVKRVLNREEEPEEEPFVVVPEQLGGVAVDTKKEPAL